ncbi:MAG TPA: hypothetical protein VNZ57_04505, partial [Longimicrobiales bacterium]|nr:hypothetical protein [Longimicrobiales bacterium]
MKGSGVRPGRVVAARPGGTSAGPVEVTPVRRRRDLKDFLMLPWRIYARDRVWVPPLLADQRALLDRRKHPFHAHAEVEYFVARRGGRTVGRVVAGINHRHNEFHDERAGFFGFFESVEDAGVASALLDAVEAWLAEREIDVCRGPMNFSSNEEWGLLVDGFEYPPTIMMTHNPPYYSTLLEARGYTKAKDVLAFLLDDPALPARLAGAMERFERRRGVTVRALDMRQFSDELERVKDIYNSAWEKNWGFIPMTDAEFEYMAKQLRPVLDPRFCLFAEVDGEAVAFLLALPDFNQAIRYANGRLFPTGLLKILWHRRNIDRMRVLTLGVKTGYRRLGIDAMLYTRTWVDAA